MLTDKNADRFKGFADIYDSARPSCPENVVRILSGYLHSKPDTVIDIGCGTGLSTLIWANNAEHIIGVEPSDDMRHVALTRTADIPNISFIKAFSNETGLPDNSADIITCSQSFHWMEPVATLKEVNRLLKSGGVFAVYDCDWPPVCSADVELAYVSLMKKVHKIEHENKKYSDLFIKYPKENHLKNIESSGYFKYSREIVFMNEESCDAERFFNIAMSQGSLQEIIKDDFDLIKKELDTLKIAVNEYFEDELKNIGFCYRMRLGLK